MLEHSDEPLRATRSNLQRIALVRIKDARFSVLLFCYHFS
jgi:hypothetical protein